MGEVGGSIPPWPPFCPIPLGPRKGGPEAPAGGSEGFPRGLGPHELGGLAQSVECVVSNDEAPGSKPGFSTLFGARAIDWNQKRSPGVTTHRTDLPGYGPAILPLSTAAAFPCSVAGLRRFTAHYQPRGPRLRANPAVDHRLGSDRPWLHMTSQVGGAKHRIHIGLSAHSGHRRALPRPTNQ